MILRWLTQRNVVGIPKSVNKERIIENFDIFDFELSMDELAQIAALDTDQTLFMSYHDPKFAKMLGTLKVEL